MAQILAVDDYRKAIRNWVKARPNKGRGELRKIAELLAIPSSVLSQILAGQRDLNLDQAYLLCEYMGLVNFEKEYFLNLVQIEKANHHKYKSFLKDKLEQIRQDSLNLSKRVAHEKTLSEEDQMEFYSSWIYSAIRLQTSIGNGLSLEEIRQRFRLSTKRASEIVDFLLRNALIVPEKNRFRMGPQRTHLSRDSAMVARHHTNWRLKAIEKAGSLSKQELMFTGPLTCSAKDANLIQEKITKLIQEVSEIVKDSEATQLMYMGLDFVRMDID